MHTRAMAKELSAASTHKCLFVDFLSEEEPKKVSEALKHPGWVDAMQEELNQFARNKVWTLVPPSYGKTIIGYKWIFINKRDEFGIVIKNKVWLVAQGYNQQEGIDYDETFDLVTRVEAIRIFLAFATYMNFTVLRAVSSPTMFANWIKPYMDLNKLQEHGMKPSQPSSLNTSLFMVLVVKENKRIHKDMELKRRSKLKLKAFRHMFTVLAITREAQKDANAKELIASNSSIMGKHFIIIPHLPLVCTLVQ
ncbi:retrovirus-related pol polyprotein from transposon TNT 1-94 [Tanacetum coccineum]